MMLSEEIDSLATVVSYINVGESVYEKVLVRLRREPDKVRWFYEVQLQALPDEGDDRPLSSPLPAYLTPVPGPDDRNIGLWQPPPGAEGLVAPTGEAAIEGPAGETPAEEPKAVFSEDVARRLPKQARLQVEDPVLTYKGELASALGDEGAIRQEADAVPGQVELGH